MNKIVWMLIIQLSSLLSLSQVIPEERRVGWAGDLNEFQIEYPDNLISVHDFGAVGDGFTDDTDAIVDALNALNGQEGMIYFPTGTYLLTQTLSLDDHQFLKGNGADSCCLLFSLGQQGGHCIQISRDQPAEFIQLDDGFVKGSNWITTDSAFVFSADDFVEITQENGGWDIVPIDWASNSVGQIAKIQSVFMDTLYLTRPLRFTYSPDLNPRIRLLDPIMNTGIECLKIKRLDEVAGEAGSNIYIENAVNCVVQGVESDSSVGSHLSIHRSSNILIQGCYFHHAFTYDGEGTRGYGVTLHTHSGQCLITNNIFKYLRHAMMVKTGANGNVFSYNYSREPYRTETIHDASGDISLHGHFAYANLFEHNIVQNIVIDHYWGPSGPWNTFFRNRAELYGIIMTTNAFYETTDQNFVGNETTNGAAFHGQYFLTGSQHFEYGNNILGVTIPAGTDNLTDSSYYLNIAPAFWNPQDGWPSIGLPNTLNSGTIPAKERYIEGDILTLCPDSIQTNTGGSREESVSLQYWPNPALETLFVRYKLPPLTKARLSIRSTTGQILVSLLLDNASDDGVYTIDLSHIEQAGLYFLMIKLPNQVITRKLIIADN